MHILIAPNAFKNSLDATSVAEAIGEGLQQSRLQASLEYFPIGDGGDGTAALIIQQQKGKIINVEVYDPLKRKIQSKFGLIDDDKTAVIELADASGIRLLKADELNPLHTTTFGTGELIKYAINKNVNKIILCIGGSATVDGGTGILQALGIKFLNREEELLNDLPANLMELASIDVNNFDRRILDRELVILCDVENVLLGESGTAKVFGPQKGATEKDVLLLEKALTKFKDVVLKESNIDISIMKHGGAAGGVAAALYTFCNAKLVNGIDCFLSLNNFDAALQKADLLITGEGKIDEQTLNGKGPVGVAVKAKEKNIPVIGVAGSIPLKTNPQLEKYFDVLISINNDVTSLKDAMRHTKDNLIRTGKMIGDMISITDKQSD